MSGASPAAAVPPTRTGGAWLGLGIAAGAGFVVVLSALLLAAIELVPSMIDGFAGQIDRAPNSAEIPPEFWQVIEVCGEAASILRPFTRAVGGTGIVLGVLTLVASIGLLQGSEFSRRATRALLVLDGVHTIGQAAWMVVLSFTRLDAWYVRYLAAVKAMMEHAPEAKRLLLPEVQGFGVMNAISTGVQAVMTLVILGLLFWLAGRPFAREWCAARARKAAS